MERFKAGMSEETRDKNPEKFLMKRCPHCFVSLELDARRCYSCKSRVGNVDKHGKAKKKVNWYSYAVCIAAWGALILYVRWAFF